ncbi:hypothetical protein AAE02nite_25730 [Adhaeribacter aerolatus]|uniref:T9SS type A sorting domain-containing protein n=2 Tax=Adhaeribacter aerolatus TaxID=670289 RepID=A0A512AYW7_9BACT|nr:hypothetical protein AAE02nite_25730 [Adhaeribacter aerolatus]
MTLGNSITQSNSSYKSYRYPLWKKLVDARMSFDLVGSMRGHHLGNPAWPTHNGLSFDQDHEGHWGWRADEIVNGRSGLGKLSDWLQGYTPDIVLLHLGTNDLYQGQGVSSTLADIRQVVGIIRAKNPKVVVLLAKLIPVASLHQGKAAIEAYNLQVPGLAQELHRLESPVILVDQFSGYNASLDNYDGMHPNAHGEEKMATKWFQALQPFFNSSSCPQAPLVTSKSHCGPGSVTLSASGASSTGSYRWYTSSSGGTPISNLTSATYTTPVLTATTTYYVSVVNNGCESPRVPVVATIHPKPAVVVTASAQTITAGGSTTLTASGANTYSWSPATGLSSVNGTSVTAKPSSTTTYTVTGAGANGCTSIATITITVNNTGLQSQTITFPSIQNKIYGDAPFNLNATSSSGLHVSYNIVSGPATVSGKTLTITGPGTVSVRAYHPGNDQYSAATPVVQSFSITTSAKHNQTITFAPIHSKTYGEAPFTISATTTSGLPVSFSILSGPATVYGNTITLTGVGVVTVKAFQAGNNYFNSASAQSSFNVQSAGTTYSGCSLALTSSVTQAESWYGMWGAATGAGAIDLSVTHGTAPFTYKWSNGSTSQDLVAVAPGQFAVTVTDAKGCTAKTTVYVGRKNDPLRLSASHLNASSTSSRDASINISVLGGIGPYNYRWNNGATTEDLTGIAAGQYTITVTDAFGQKASMAVNILAPGIALATTKKPVQLEEQVIKDTGLTVYPNPAKGKVTATFSLKAAGTYSLELYDVRGMKVKTISSGQSSGSKSLEVDLSGYTTGVYFFKLTTDIGVSSSRVLIER